MIDIFSLWSIALHCTLKILLHSIGNVRPLQLVEKVASCQCRVVSFLNRYEDTILMTSMRKAVTKKSKSGIVSESKRVISFSYTFVFSLLQETSSEQAKIYTAAKDESESVDP